jgi:hypothetical protein
MPNAAKITAFSRTLKNLARAYSFSADKVGASANTIWTEAGNQSVVPADLAIDTDLITLGLAKDDGGIVYMKYNLTGWDE